MGSVKDGFRKRFEGAFNNRKRVDTVLHYDFPNASSSLALWAASWALEEAAKEAEQYGLDAPRFIRLMKESLSNGC